MERPPAKPARDQTDRQEIASQVKDILEIIGIAELTDHIVQDHLAVLRLEVVRTAQTNVVLDILRQRGQHDPFLNQRFH